MSASTELVELIESSNRALKDDIMMLCAEHFERRLVEETSRVRVEMAQLGNHLRQEMRAGFSELRQEIATLRQDNATNRVELLKWAFLFWAGQLVSLVSVLGVMLRAGR